MNKLPGSNPWVGRPQLGLWPALLSIYLLLLAGPPAFAQPATPTPSTPSSVTLDIVQLGFLNLDKDGGSRPYVLRNGELAPLEVRLSNLSGREFKGRLEMSVPDPDGDLLTVRNDLVALTPSQHDRAYVLSFPANFGENFPRQTQVRLLDDTGRLVQSAVLQHEGIKELNDKQRLILTLGPRVLPFLTGLQDFSSKRDDQGLLEQWSNFSFARLNLEQVPTQSPWLKAADTIVWNDPTPTALSPGQLQTLQDWTAAGGWLVLCVGSNYQQLAGSALAPLLPAKITSAQSGLYDNLTKQRRSAVWCSFADIQPDAEMLLRVPEQTLVASAAGQPLAWRRSLGKGCVVLVGCEWTDLPVLLGAATFGNSLGTLLGQRDWGIKQRTPDPNQGSIYQSEVRLAESVRHLVNFNLAQTLYILLEVTFLLVYVGLITFGVWKYLQKRSRQVLNWTVFALVAGISSFLALAGVRLLKGRSVEVHQVNFVDLWAGSSEGLAESLFGLKTGDDRRLSAGVFVPGLPDTPEICRQMSLYPLIAESGGVQRFLAAQSYDLNMHPSSAGKLLQEVPLRSTLKQFFAQYPTRLSGMVTAELQAGLPGSKSISGWLQNGLNTRLHHCFLIWQEQQFNLRGLPSYPALILPIVGRDRTTVAPAERVDVGWLWDDSQVPPAPAGKEPAEKKPDGQKPAVDLSLANNQLAWAQKLAPYSLGQRRDLAGVVSVDTLITAMLFLTTAEAFVSDREFPRKPGEKESAQTEYLLHRSLFRSLDRLATLSSREALLIAFSEDVLPGELTVDQRPVAPAPGYNLTVLRVTIPLRK